MSTREHAVVMGASMAGLLTARVLASHFARVTIVERDTLPVETLREIARDDREGARRQPAALALAVLRDEAAWTVMRTDPVWAIRDKVTRMLADGQDAGEGRQPA